MSPAEEQQCYNKGCGKKFHSAINSNGETCLGLRLALGSL